MKPLFLSLLAVAAALAAGLALTQPAESSPLSGSCSNKGLERNAVVWDPDPPYSGAFGDGQYVVQTYQCAVQFKGTPQQRMVWAKLGPPKALLNTQEKPAGVVINPNRIGQSNQYDIITQDGRVVTPRSGVIPADTTRFEDIRTAMAGHYASHDICRAVHNLGISPRNVYLIRGDWFHVPPELQADSGLADGAKMSRIWSHPNCQLP